MATRMIYSVVTVNEGMEVVDVRSFTDEKAAREYLNNEYNCTKNMLKYEGWDEDSLSEDELNDGASFQLEYGESAYYCELVRGVLNED